MELQIAGFHDDPSHSMNETDKRALLRRYRDVIDTLKPQSLNDPELLSVPMLRDHRRCVFQLVGGVLRPRLSTSKVEFTQFPSKFWQGAIAPGPLSSPTLSSSLSMQFM